MRNRGVILVVVLQLFIGCKSAPPEDRVSKSDLPVKRVAVPNFKQDSAYAFIQRQVQFGPRVPNSSAHQAARKYIVRKLESYGAKVIEQDFMATTFDGKRLNLTNIIASYSPEQTKRILLAAHWDTRPFADKDEQIERRNDPIEGANDGASGVAVLLEIARAIHGAEEKPQVGIDFILFDGEDWGERNDGPKTTPSNGLESWWSLGSQYWSKNKHRKNYSAYYGILLDMVGGKNAQFRIEGLSDQYAGKVVKKIWDWGNALGHGTFFVYKKEMNITDDHKFVNEIARIPMVDIVHFEPPYGYFGDFHHSHKDNLTLIDKEVLRAVGETVLHVIYHE